MKDPSVTLIPLYTPDKRSASNCWLNSNLNDWTKPGAVKR
jgi:hypothetical protein